MDKIDNEERLLMSAFFSWRKICGKREQKSNTFFRIFSKAFPTAKPQKCKNGLSIDIFELFIGFLPEEKEQKILSFYI